MKKFKLGEKEFEMDYPNDVAPVVIGEKSETEKVNLQELKDRYKNNKIFSYSANIFDEETGKLKFVTFYYIGAKCVNAKEYRHISEYTPESPPKNMLIEIILQVENFKRTFYSNIKNTNCSMMDLIDIATEDIKEKLFNSEDEETTSLFLYDDGGWQIDTEICSNDLENFITSIRLVEEV